MRVVREFKRQGKPYESDGLMIELSAEDLGIKVTRDNWKKVMSVLLYQTWVQGMKNLVKSGHQTIEEATNHILKYNPEVKQDGDTEGSDQS